jgi:peptidoglycan/LPS O-acetylase OafA/YrhL
MARSRDNFGVLRLGAATAVLVSHAFGLTGRVDPLTPVSGQALGAAAVGVFFAISGYLVVGSWCRDPHLLRFLARRARRIWPALTVAVLFTAYVVGPLFTRLPVRDYLDSGGTHVYVLAKLGMLRADHLLPGVFAANPLATANGSLWTLPLEVQAYLVVAVLGLAGALRRGWFLRAAWLFSVGAAVLVEAFDISTAVSISPQEAYLVAVFLGGALLYRERERVPLRGGVAAALIVAWFATRGTVVQVAVGAVAFPYASLWLALRTRPVLGRLVGRADLSYGLYLYAYPVEQAIRAGLGPSATPAITIALALPITGSLALVSWHVVEKPWLRRTQRAEPSLLRPDSRALAAAAEVSAHGAG